MIPDHPELLAETIADLKAQYQALSDRIEKCEIPPPATPETVAAYVDDALRAIDQLADALRVMSPM